MFAGADPWEFGWDALVAIGTIGLAGVTGTLAYMTWRLARSTAAEARAQTRPVLIPGLGGTKGTRWLIGHWSTIYRTVGYS
jgi:hypothetical protein